METQVYKIEPTNGSDIQELARNGELISLREELSLPPLEIKEGSDKFFRFRPLTEEENSVFSVLFPCKTKLSKYKRFVPLEVLQAYKEFIDTCTCPYIEEAVVWHAKEYDPDPVLVVPISTENDGFSFSNALILIARWGEVLLPFEQLKEKAFKVWKETKLTALEGIKEEVELELHKVNKASTINNNDLSIPSFFK